VTDVDDKAFDDYLSRRSEVTRAYRDLDAGEVPPALDRLVLEQAHAAVAGKRKSSWLRYGPPVALAASVVFGVAIVFESNLQHDSVIEATYPSAPASAPPATEPVYVQPTEMAPPVLARDKAELPEPAMQAAPVGAREPEALAEAVEAIAPPPAPTAPAPAAAAGSEPAAVFGGRADSITVNDSRTRAAANEALPSNDIDAKRLERVDGPRDPTRRRIETDARSSAVDEANRDRYRRSVPMPPASARNAAPTPAPDLQSRQPLTKGFAADAANEAPGPWLARIRELRKQNQGEAADREWVRFLAAYPEFPVEENDLAKPVRSK
jgi:hypothetical protein